MRRQLDLDTVEAAEVMRPRGVGVGDRLPGSLGSSPRASESRRARVSGEAVTSTRSTFGLAESARDAACETITTLPRLAVSSIASWIRLRTASG